MAAFQASLLAGSGAEGILGREAPSGTQTQGATPCHLPLCLIVRFDLFVKCLPFALLYIVDALGPVLWQGLLVSIV